MKEINNKLFSFEGFMGRRDYFLNIIYLACFYMFVSIPFQTSIFIKINSYSDLLNTNKLFYSFSPFFKAYILIGTLIIGVLSISNAIRRLNDINGKVNICINIITSALLLISYFGFLLPFKYMLVLFGVVFIIDLVLFLKKGKLTSELPYDFTKEFNWGAFLGTWIWGLFNKSYIPLLHLILFFTPWNILFLLICGLKGNEWAYKNKKYDNIDKFNESQKKQTIFWIVFNFIIIPIIIFFSSIAIAIYSVAKLSNSKDADKNITKVEEYIKKINSLDFVSYTLSDKENKFYVTKKEWSYYSFSDKVQALQNAAKIAANEKNNEQITKDIKDRKKYYEFEELSKTKIYSKENGKLLGEFNEPDMKEGKSFFDYIKSTMNGFKFYDAD